MNSSTIFMKNNEVKRNWHVIDATGQSLGRLAVTAADILRGKVKVCFSKDVDCGDFVIITNAAKVVLTGNKLEQKVDFRHSFYPGGAKFTPYKRIMAETPEKAVRTAVKGMLAKNKLGARQLRRLRIFRDDKHTHAAQLAKETKSEKKEANTKEQ